VTRTCPICDQPFTFDETKRGRRREQCSRACTNQAYRDRRSVAKQAERVASARPCESCGEAIVPKSLGLVPRWCSTFCSEVARGARFAEPLPAVMCALPGCDVEFIPNRHGVRCCSERHGQVLWNRESRADGRQKSEAWGPRRRENWQRRRALKLGLDAERIDNAVIFDRDKWCCGICSKRVDSALAWPDPMSASLDHILPLSKGGSHVPANVQLAHLGCNVRKGNRIAA